MLERKSSEKLSNFSVFKHNYLHEGKEHLTAGCAIH